MKLNLAQAIPPALPSGAAPYGTLICSRMKCRAITARKHAAGGLPSCQVCRAPMVVHPDSAKSRTEKERAADVVVDLRPGNLGVFGRGLRSQSPIDMFDADNECPHGWLPHQGCELCGVTASGSYPGVDAVIAAERAFFSEAA